MNDLVPECHLISHCCNDYCFQFGFESNEPISTRLLRNVNASVFLRTCDADDDFELQIK